MGINYPSESAPFNPHVVAVVGLSVAAIVLTALALFWAGLSWTKTLTLFCGLEGTALLASAFSVRNDGSDSSVPKGPIRRLVFWFGEGSSWGFPSHYNPVCYYGGLALLATSILLSAVT